MTPALPDAACAELLARWPVARLATLAGDGRARLVPIVFAQSGSALWSPIDGKPKGEGELERVRNLRRDPRATLLIDHYDADWRRLFWLRLDARARVRAVPEDSASPERRGVAALLDKYPQYRATPLFRGVPTLLEFRVEARRSWCADPSAAAWRAPPSQETYR